VGEWQWHIQPIGKEASGYPVSVMSPITVIDGETSAASTTLAAEARGHDLFLNKGCISCHTNTRVKGNTVATVGPNLSAYQNEAEFLRRWLSDPRAMKPATVMPKLQLSDEEIAALIAFINAPR
jgi:mono/diheme cytochrome c family protein